MIDPTLDRDPTDLDLLEREQDELRVRRRTDEELALSDLLKLMNQPWGRRIAWRIIRDAGLDSSSFSPNAMQMSREEGRKELARGWRRIFDRLCPELYVTMLKENTSDRTADHRS